MSITTRNGFRLFFLFGVLAGIGSYIDWIFPSLVGSLPEELSSMDEGDSNGMLYFYFTVVHTIIYVTSLIGIFRFRKWGRVLFLVQLLLSIIALPFYPVYHISSGLSSVLSAVSYLVAHVSIAIMYLSPINKYFGKSGPESN